MTVLPLERVLVLPAPPADSSVVYIEVREAEPEGSPATPMQLHESPLPPVVVYRLACASPEERSDWAKEISAAAAEWGALHVECTPGTWLISHLASAAPFPVPKSQTA